MENKINIFTIPRAKTYDLYFYVKIQELTPRALCGIIIKWIKQVEFVDRWRKQEVRRFVLDYKSVMSARDVIEIISDSLIL